RGGFRAQQAGCLLDWMRLASSKSSGLKKRGGFRAQQAGRLLSSISESEFGVPAAPNRSSEFQDFPKNHHS
ncbi:MAG: hypothetical protein LHW58_07255, partial [Candidatus Cloacimonetes bacterium]|nr:hypothetical protein [Candidatus Cloacimonadota bacterium]MCK9178718.1 hypothetical protein [Candidatus Cloacimonadota bacterium]